MIYNQAYLFLIFTLNGSLIAVIFDIFRILRKCFNTKDWVTYIEDIFFWIITGSIIIYSMYTFCDGELRLFMVLGLMFGFLIYILTVSKYIINISVKIISLIKKILSIPFKIMNEFIKKYIIRPISFIYNKINIKITKFTNKSYNNIKKLKKIEQNRGILKKK